MWDVPAPAVPALAVTLTFCCVSAMIVSARLYTRIFLVRNPGLDDWFMLAALVSLQLLHGCNFNLLIYMIGCFNYIFYRRLLS